MALQWSDVTSIIKTQYLPTMIDWINTEDYLTKYVEKNKQTENVGNLFTKSFRYGHSEGTGMLTSVTGALENPGRSAWKTFTGSPKWRDGVIKIYETIAQLMNSDEKSFIDEVTAETEGIADSMKCEKERMNYGDGGVTQLATVTSATDASPSVITLAAPSTTKYLRPGMPIDFLTAAKAAITNGSNLIIQDILSDTTFTVDLVVTAATRTTLVAALATSVIYHKGGYNNEFQGLKGLFGSTANTVLGIDRSQNAGAWFRPNVKRVKTDGSLEDGAPAGTPYDPTMVAMMGIINKLVTQKKANKGEMVIFAPDGVATQLVSKKLTNNEYIQPAKKIDLWPYETVAFNGVPILSGNYSPDNTAFIVDMSGIVQFLAKKLSFSEMDGNMWKWVSGYAAYTAYLLESYEMGHYFPWKCATIYDIKSAY